MKTKVALAGLLVLVAAVRSDLSWGQQIGFGPGQSMDPAEVIMEIRASKAPAVPMAVLAGYVAANDPSAGEPGQAVEWVSIRGGKFAMGTDDSRARFDNAKPIHEVNIKDFQMSKTLVTVEQYEECVIKGGCTPPDTRPDCRRWKAGKQRHPVNCVDWKQANQYAKFKGARLPSESEYEYAATSGGKNRKYPWGNNEPTCDKAVYGDGYCGSPDVSLPFIDEGDVYGGYGLRVESYGTTEPVCSKPAGNAKVSGGELCDMVGNVWQWMQDKYQDSYIGAPTDGSAFEAAGSDRVVLRGGSYGDTDADSLRAANRFGTAPDGRWFDVGFRLARSSR